MQSVLFISLFLLQVSFILGSTQHFVQLVCSIHNTTCLNAEARDMLSILVEGNSVYHTQPLDPMFIDYLHIDTGDYKLDLREIHVTGLKNAMIEDVSLDFSTKIFRMQFSSDFSFNSQYINKGFFLNMDIEGKGTSLIKLNDVDIELTMTFDLVKDAQDNDIMRLKTYNYIYDVRDSAQYYFDNLYFGNKTASNAMHKAFHQNWKSLTIEFGKYFFDVVNDNIVNAIRIHTRSRPIKEYLVY